MFAVIFETNPCPTQQSAYMSIAASLRDELTAVPGFLENVRYRSLTRPGWLLSLSVWRDEKALVRWRAAGRHHDAQARGRGGIMLDYRLRVGQIIDDDDDDDDVIAEAAAIPDKNAGGNSAPRFDVTQVGDAKCAVLVDGLRLELGDGDGSDIQQSGNPQEKLAAMLGVEGKDIEGKPRHRLTGWDVFEAVLSPGEYFLLACCEDEAAAARFQSSFNDGIMKPGTVRYRTVRIIRDYGKYARREAPQYFEDAAGRETVH